MNPDVLIAGTFNGIFSEGVLETLPDGVDGDAARARIDRMIQKCDVVKASDEALFARKEYLDKNAAAVAVFVEELIRVNREINKNPNSSGTLQQYIRSQATTAELSRASLPPGRVTRASSAAAARWSGANITPKLELTTSKLASA